MSQQEACRGPRPWVFAVTPECNRKAFLSRLLGRTLARGDTATKRQLAWFPRELNCEASQGRPEAHWERQTLQESLFCGPLFKVLVSSALDLNVFPSLFLFTFVILQVLRRQHSSQNNWTK